MSAVLTLSDQQFKKLISDPDFKKEVAKEQARLAHEAITSELGEHVGRKFPVPISLAVRISGWNEKWIRRNLKIIEAEGQHDAVQFGDLIDAMEQRKNK